MKRHKWTFGFIACLLAFTGFLVLDTFVFSRAYQADATEMNLEMIRDAEQEAAAASGNRESETSGEPETSTISKPSTPGNDSKGESADHAQKSFSSSDGETAGTETGKPSGSKMRKPSKSRTGTSSGKKGADPDAKDSTSAPKSSEASAAAAAAAAAEAAAVTTENAGDSQTYEDENIQITYTQYTTNDTTVHVADVRVSSAEYLKTAFANNTYGKNVTANTSDIAAANNAILAVNGDYYGTQESGYVIRNGVVYRDKAGKNEVLCIYADGHMEVVDPSTVTAQELVDQGVWQAFSFGPGLIENGEITVSLNSEVGRAKASNPRTAIGIIDDLHYVFVVSDGRSEESEGLSLYELAAFMDQLGVQTAYNLDGGGSSTMVFQGAVVNDPTGGMGGHTSQERKVSDIVYIG